MAIGLVRAAFPVATLNARGEEIPPNTESDYTPAKAAEFAIRFGETPEAARIVPPPVAPRRGKAD